MAFTTDLDLLTVLTFFWPAFGACFTLAFGCNLTYFSVIDFYWGFFLESADVVVEDAFLDKTGYFWAGLDCYYTTFLVAAPFEDGLVCCWAFVYIF